MSFPWKLTLPVDSSGGSSGTAREITMPNLLTYNSYHMQRDRDGSITFRAPVAGARTSSGTRYTRSELREMTADGSDEYEWTPETGGRMEHTCAVLELPTLTKGNRTAVIIGQIHGPDDEPCRLYYDYVNGAGVLRFADDKAIKGTGTAEQMFTLTNVAGQPTAIPIGSELPYAIEMDATAIRVSAVHNGHEYSALSPLSPFWRGKRCYFKCGAYNAVARPGMGAVNEGTGQSVVRFRGISAPIHPYTIGSTPVDEKPTDTPDTVIDTPPDRLAEIERKLDLLYEDVRYIRPMLALVEGVHRIADRLRWLGRE